MFISKISLLMFTSLCVATRKEDSYTRSINKCVKSISELANHANFAKRIDPYARINNLKSDIESDDEIAPKFKDVNVSYLNCILGDLVGLGLSIQSETEIQSTRSLNQLHGDSLLAAVMDLAKQADAKNNLNYESSVDDAASVEGTLIQWQERASFFERQATSLVEQLKEAEERLEGTEVNVIHSNLESKKIESLEKEKAALTTQLEEAKHKLEQARANVNESLEAQKATITTLEAKLAEATQKLTAAAANTTASESLEAQKATITTLEAKLAEATEKLASANTISNESLEAQKATITTLEAKLAEATQRLESNNTNIDESLQVEQDKVKSLEVEKADLEEKLAEAAQNLQAKIQANAGQAESLKEAQDKVNALASEKVDLVKKFAENIDFLNTVKVTLEDASALEDKNEILEIILAVLEGFQDVNNSAVNEGNLSLIPQTSASQLVFEHLSQTHHDSKSDEGLHEVNSAAEDISEHHATPRGNSPEVASPQAAEDISEHHATPTGNSQEPTSLQASPLGEDLIFVQIKSKGVQNPEFFRIKRSDAETFGLNEVENTSGKSAGSIAIAKVEGKNLKTGRLGKSRNLIALK